MEENIWEMKTKNYTEKLTILVILLTLLTFLIGFNIYAHFRLQSINNRIQELNKNINSVEESLKLPPDFFNK